MNVFGPPPDNIELSIRYHWALDDMEWQAVLYLNNSPIKILAQGGPDEATLKQEAQRKLVDLFVEAFRQ